MSKFEINKMINRKVEDVFDYVTRVENLPVWYLGVFEVKAAAHPQPTGAGMTYRVLRQFLSKNHEVEEQVTEYEPNKAQTV